MAYGDVIAFMNREAAWYLCKRCAVDVFAVLEKLGLDGYEASFADFLEKSNSISLNYLAFQLNEEEEWKFEEALIRKAVEGTLLDPRIPWKREGEELKRRTVRMLQEGYYHDQAILNKTTCTRCGVALKSLCKDYP